MFSNIRCPRRSKNQNQEFVYHAKCRVNSNHIQRSILGTKLVVDLIYSVKLIDKFHCRMMLNVVILSLSACYAKGTEKQFFSKNLQLYFLFSHLLH